MTLFRKASSLHLQKPDLAENITKKKSTAYSVEKCSYNWRKQLKLLDQSKFDISSINELFDLLKKDVFPYSKFFEEDIILI